MAIDFYEFMITSPNNTTAKNAQAAVANRCLNKTNEHAAISGIKRETVMIFAVVEFTFNVH